MLGTTVSGKPLSVSAGGLWSLVVFADQVTPGETITVEVTGTDGAGLTDVITFDLNIGLPDRSARHAINRITFGATPELLAEVNAAGCGRLYHPSSSRLTALTTQRSTR